MPRAFTKQEKTGLRKALRLAARESIARFGLRRTRVADVARAAGISKGGFYIFYESREDLFQEVFALVEQEVRQELLEAAKGDDVESIRGFLQALFQLAIRYPILLVLSDPDESSLLWRGLHANAKESWAEDEEHFYRSIFARWSDRGLIPEADPRTLARLPRVAAAIARERAIIGEEHYQQLVDLMVASLVRTLTDPE